MLPPGRTLILSDGGCLGLLACGILREALTIAQADGQSAKAEEQGYVLAFPLLAGRTRTQREAVGRQAELFGLKLIDPPALLTAPAEAGSGELESLELLVAAHLGARRACERILWAASGAAGDSLDLDRIAQITDRAVLIGRLAAIDAATHGVPSLRIEAPYADFTDRQVADLILDMDLPIGSCWWWGSADTDAAAAAEQRRWMPALEAVGYRA